MRWLLTEPMVLIREPCKRFFARKLHKHDDADIQRTGLQAFMVSCIGATIVREAVVCLPPRSIRASHILASSISASQPSTNGAASMKKSVAKVARPKNAFTMSLNFVVQDLRHALGRELARKTPSLSRISLQSLRGSGQLHVVLRESSCQRRVQAESRGRGRHAIVHPGYQYQPRKPSKKKRVRCK